MTPLSKEQFDVWWKENGIESATFAEKSAARKGWNAAIAALPKPEPIGEVFMGLLAFDDDELIAEIQQERFNNLPDGAKLYTEAPIAPPASEQKPVALPFAIFDQEITDLRRFHECAMDDEGYDVTKDRMKRLAEIGLVRRVSANYYEHTDFGLSVLNGDFDSQPQPDYKAQRDAERYRWLLENNKSWSWNPAKYNKEIITGFAAFNTEYLGFEFEPALDAAIASVKGGSV